MNWIDSVVDSVDRYDFVIICSVAGKKLNLQPLILQLVTSSRTWEKLNKRF